MPKSQVLIPTQDYDIDCSELEITFSYSNSRAPGGSCAAYDIEPSVSAIVPKTEPALELQSRAALSMEAHHRVSGHDTRRNSRGRHIIKTRLKPTPKPLTKCCSKLECAVNC